MSLADLVVDFCRKTINGHESGMYKSCSSSLLPMPRTFLQTAAMQDLMMGATVAYLNGVYKSLILKNDKYIIDEFAKMQAIHNHSSVCLLNFVFYIISEVKLDRAKLDISTYDAYMKCVIMQSDVILATIKSKLPELLSHVCTGIDISKCDPNDPMFKITKE